RAGRGERLRQDERCDALRVGGGEPVDEGLALPFGVSRVTERLFLGGAISGQDHMAWLAAQGVTHVISAAGELSDRTLCNACDLGYYHLHWYDDKQSKPASEFLHVLEWVLGEEAAMLRTGRQMALYVHCAMGLNRGP